ncbi:MAG: hypothetical protein MUF04_14020, partial [Akkermansiaceae bacterium]|nr:hypothetical protein [Akkermansiaceae bacterium]
PPFLALAAAFLALPLTAPANPSDSIFKEFNDLGYGTLSGRFQNLSMYRDIELRQAYGYNSTLEALLAYNSPQFGGFDLGWAYNYAFTLFEGGNTSLLANDDINILNEAWGRFNFDAAGLGDNQIVAGRKIVDGEVFRADDFRQKSRSIEALQFITKEIPDTTLTMGHAIRLSNWLGSGDQWNFNDFGDVFYRGKAPGAGMGYDTDGVTWAEALYTGFDGWEIALFDAYAWDVANLVGTRIQYSLNKDAKLIGYYRHENAVGKAPSRQSDAYGLSYQHNLGKFTLEPGYFAVHGADLMFQEYTTGINHPLGASMIICSCQFYGGAQTAFIKATTKVGKTTLYCLYNYTWHDKNHFDGQEVNLVVKYPITDCFSVCFKGGVGYRDWQGRDNTTSTDSRLFITYTF